jgi:hypothetical protein
MKNYLLFSILCCLCSEFSFGQNWISLDKPQSGVVGKLISGDAISGNRLDNSLILTEDGASEYKQEANSHFNLALKVTNFDRIKYMSLTVDTMSIDYLSDKALYTNDNYFTNPFVYKAIRAKSVTISFRKNFTGKIDPSEILGPKIAGVIKKVIPLFDSLKISYEKNDTLAIKIFNPKVYFEAIAIQLVSNDCRSCRVSFESSFNTDDDVFTMDLADAVKSSSTVSVQEGTKPSFTLSLGQEPDNDDKLNLTLSMDQGFVNANPNLTSSTLTVPYREIKVNGKKFRRFSFNNPQFYLGSIRTTDKTGIWSRVVTLDIPVFISITAEQTSATEVKFVNKDPSSKYMSKLEYPEYSFVAYTGKIL